MRYRRTPLLAFLFLGLTGCGTVINLGIQRCPIYDHPRIYGAVRIDAVHIAPEEFPLGLVLALVDLPFSLAFDTLSLPCSIPLTITRGDEDSWPKPSRPHAIVEGVVIQGDTSGYRVVPVGDIWRGLPAGLIAVQGAGVHVFAQANGPEVTTQGTLTSNAQGHFSLFSEWDTPWKIIRIDGDGYQPVEIPVSKLQSPTDQSYWSEHRILVTLAKP